MTAAFTPPLKMIFDSRRWWSWLCITCVMKTKNRNTIYYLPFTLEVTCYCNNVHVWAMWSEPLSLVWLADLSEFIPATGNADVTSWLNTVNVLKCQSWQLHQQVVFTVVAYFFLSKFLLSFSTAIESSATSKHLISKQWSYILQRSYLFILCFTYGIKWLPCFTMTVTAKLKTP